VLIVLSTPRSGSTLLCDFLRINEACLPHEYFQPHQYMQILADRWGCVTEGVLDPVRYINALRKFRTYANGWLGINLHGSHLEIFLPMKSYLPDVRFHFIHVKRKDEIAQAVSYYIASETGQWSSHFRADSQPLYDFHGIELALEKIQRQNSNIDSYLSRQSSSYMTVYYEDLVANPVDFLKRLPCIKTEQIETSGDSLKKQSSGLSLKWIDKFTRDLKEDKTISGKWASVQKLIKRN